MTSSLGVRRGNEQKLCRVLLAEPQCAGEKLRDKELLKHAIAAR